MGKVRKVTKIRKMLDIVQKHNFVVKDNYNV